MERVGRAGAGFASICETIDTNTTGGRLVFHVMGALAEFERGLIVERTKAGLEAARRRGAVLGRPRKLTAQQVAHACEMVRSGRMQWKDMADMFGVDPSTLRRAARKMDD